MLMAQNLCRAGRPLDTRVSRYNEIFDLVCTQRPEMPIPAVFCTNTSNAFFFFELI
ncbi:UNVERIFIED_CONTAM: hypothetical protein FKN15_072271 [Acipenser sinensis]